MFVQSGCNPYFVCSRVAFNFSFPRAARSVVYKYLRDAVILTVVRREASDRKTFQVLKTWKV